MCLCVCVCVYVCVCEKYMPHIVTPYANGVPSTNPCACKIPWYVVT